MRMLNGPILSFNGLYSITGVDWLIAAGINFTSTTALRFADLEANQWLHLTPRVAALGADAFEHGPVMIKKIHAYLVKEVNLAENAEEKSAEFVNRVCQVTLEAFWTQKVKGEESFDRTDSMLEGL